MFYSYSSICPYSEDNHETNYWNHTILLALTNAVYAETAPEEAWNKTFGGDGGEARDIRAPGVYRSCGCQRVQNAVDWGRRDGGGAGDGLSSYVQELTGGIRR